MSERRCSRCRIEKPLTPDHFYRDTPKHGGFSYRCKDCKKGTVNKAALAKRAKRWLETHREERTVSARAYYARNRDRINEEKRAARAADPDSYRAYHKQWRAKNIAKARAAGRRHIARNPEPHRARARQWNSNNRERFLLHCRAAQHKRRHWAKAHGGSFTAADVQRQFASQSGRCFYCDVELTDFHCDHFVPLSRGGSNDASNIVIACPRCNLRKHARLLPKGAFVANRDDD